MLPSFFNRTILSPAHSKRIIGITVLVNLCKDCKFAIRVLE